MNVFIQIIGIRLFPQIGLLNSVFLGFIFGFLNLLTFELYIYLVVVSNRSFTVNLITEIIIYAALSYCYFVFINLGETARRIRILREVFDAPEGFSLEEILRRYNAKEIIELRLQRLLANGQIIAKEDKYYIGKPLMLWMAKIVVAFKFILLGKKSEFD